MIESVITALFIWYVVIPIILTLFLFIGTAPLMLGHWIWRRLMAVLARALNLQDSSPESFVGALRGRLANPRSAWRKRGDH